MDRRQALKRIGVTTLTASTMMTILNGQNNWNDVNTDNNGNGQDNNNGNHYGQIKNQPSASPDTDQKNKWD